MWTVSFTSLVISVFIQIKFVKAQKPIQVYLEAPCDSPLKDSGTSVFSRFPLERELVRPHLTPLPSATAEPWWHRCPKSGCFALAATVLAP